jgi:hypothetical protein
LRLAGLPFAVEAEGGLSEAEATILGRLERAAGAETTDRRERFFHLWLVDERPWPGADRAAWPDYAPATVVAFGDHVRITHRRFLAEIDPARLSGRLFSPERAGYGLEVALRLALAARLPLSHGVPLHAAGIVAGPAGLAFFGPSGAGKSTLASTSPFPVLSDELVIVRSRPARLQPAGFWGTLGGSAAGPSRPVPLGALIELTKGPQLRIDPLTPALALRRLMGVVLVPPLAALWSPALGIIAGLVRDVPAFRMEWSPEAPPWEALTEILGGGLRPGSKREPEEQTGPGLRGRAGEAGLSVDVPIRQATRSHR